MSDQSKPKPKRTDTKAMIDAMDSKDYRPFAIKVIESLSIAERDLAILENEIITEIKALRKTLDWHMRIAIFAFASLGTFAMWHVNRPAHFEAAQVYSDLGARVINLENNFADHKRNNERQITEILERLRKLEGKAD